MKRIFTFLFGLFFSYISYALDVGISHATFKNDAQSYAEVYFYFAGKTLTFTPGADTLLQANVEVLITFQQNKQIIKFDKYILNSPRASQAIDFVDVKRYALDNGKYELNISLQDLHQPENKRDYRIDIEINYAENKLQQSDIQLLAAYQKTEANHPFVKNGILMEPSPLHYYGKNSTHLAFYNEIYHADIIFQEDFMLSYAIEKIENNTRQTVVIGHKRLSPQPLIPVLLQLDINQLTSGQYHLSVEVRDRNKALLSRKTTFFHRYNPYLQMDSITLANINLDHEFVGKLNAKELQFSLRALTPKLPPGDVTKVNTYLKSKDLDAQKLYLFSFWAKQQNNHPATAYENYMKIARAVDKRFNSGFRYGFETDRGYIFLKYGPPNDIEFREDEPSAPPYEIWSYYDFPATRQNNVKFIFYNPSLAPGDFQLLHTDAIGEFNNPQWELQLYRNAPDEIDGDPFDATQMKDNFHRNARRIFKDN
ncbi:MAG: GWxTD domain-containing protein [Saprospiraceae bacterium]|nr:GWxTD domain-containing protein [Saprospiraceae bacterium]